MTTTFTTRLFGGRTVGVTFDPVANTLTIMNQTLSIASLPAALQQQWQSAISGANLVNGSGPSTTGYQAKAAFGGDNVGQAIGAIMDLQPAWRSAVQQAIASYVSGLSGAGSAAAGQTITDPESWSR